ncbi:hypothetical protein OG612_04590 [Streptomyces sp. NBC_01527]|uniref:hypothetical protein n=1 Tax=unclassified Streptomyces TaxID=2593676 RepID=UPI002E144925|nr:hypothetical protein OG763_39105 [Streptomyces sp. NBC_01230]
MPRRTRPEWSRDPPTPLIVEVAYEADSHVEIYDDTHVPAAVDRAMSCSARSI